MRLYAFFISPWFNWKRNNPVPFNHQPRRIVRHSAKHRPWVNFKELRNRLKFADVLKHYGVELRQRGMQHVGPCPLPTHVVKQEGDSFSANLERGIFQCFGCKASGNVLEFAAFMSKVSPEDGNAFRKVAVELQTRFCLEGASSRTPRMEASAAPAKSPTVDQGRSINAPLGFQLKGLDTNHPSFAAVGLSQATVAHFGLGYCSRGSLKDKIVIPLHNAAGSLVGYAGCALDTFATEAPTFTFPETRERHGTEHVFDRSALIYNSHRLKTPGADLIVTTEMESVWHAHQLGRPRTVALVGDACSPELAAEIVRLVEPAGRIWFAPRGGHALSRAFFDLVLPHRFVRWVKISNGRSLAALSDQEVATRLGA